MEAISTTEKEAPKTTSKKDGGQTSKSVDKNPAQQHRNKASSGTWDGPVCYDQGILPEGHKDKYLKDHISVHCVQQAGMQGSVYEVLQYATGDTKDVKHLLPYRCNSG